VQLRHNTDKVLKRIIVDCKNCKIEGNGRKFISFYNSNNLDSAKLCYITKNNDICFGEIQLKFNNDNVIANNSWVVKLPDSNGDEVYSFCFIPNNILTILRTNRNLKNIDEVKNNYENFQDLDDESRAAIANNNKRYFASEQNYKLQYFIYSNDGPFNVINARYSEISNTDINQKPKGMTYYNKCLFINFGSNIQKLRIPAECMFEYYLTLNKLREWNPPLIGETKWDNFNIDKDFNRIEFVKKIKNYNTQTNKAGKVDFNKLQTEFIEAAKKIQKGRADMINDALTTKQKKLNEEKAAEDEIKFNQDVKNEIMKIKKEIEDKNIKEAKKLEDAKNSKDNGNSGWSFFQKGGNDEDIEEEAKRRVRDKNNSLIGKLSSFKLDDKFKVKDERASYDANPRDIKLEEYKYEASLGKSKKESNIQEKLGMDIINRYNNSTNFKYTDKDWKNFEAKYNNDLIKNSAYDFLYFDEIDKQINIGTFNVGLTVYEDKILTVSDKNSIARIL
jgi:hypothetical protein